MPPMTSQFVRSEGRSGCRKVVAEVLDSIGGVSPGVTEPPGSSPGVVSGWGAGGAPHASEEFRSGSAVMPPDVPGGRGLTPAATLAPVTSDAISAADHHDLDGDGDGPRLWVVRHGPTEWSSSGRHTGRTDVPLTPEGEREAAALRDRLVGVDFELVLTSPLQRARRTAELAGFP